MFPLLFLVSVYFITQAEAVAQKVQGEGKLSLCLTKHHTLKMYWGEWRYSSTHSLTLALDGSEWSASCPGCFSPSKRAPGTTE
jgi:hypothetical protein